MKNQDLSFMKIPLSRVKTTPKTLEEGIEKVFKKISNLIQFKKRVAFETYQGVDDVFLIEKINAYCPGFSIISANSFYKTPQEIEKITHPYVTDDEIFGFMTDLEIEAFISDSLVNNLSISEPTIIVGPGASKIISNYDFLIYADMPRWEIQSRQRAGIISSLGLNNSGVGPKALYKNSFFVDWRVLDTLKQSVYEKSDLILDTSDNNIPKLIDGYSLNQAISEISVQPFEMVPFFDPGVWGGEWMRSKFQLDPTPPNFAWCFNCVPEENHLRIQFESIYLDVPAINVVFFNTAELLGKPVKKQFGKEFPIRFDFLDTIGGQNLSFQVHPMKQYIKEKFGMNYTQEESYYLLDAESDSKVFLGLKEGINPLSLETSLRLSQEENSKFPADKFVESWDAKKHDHFLIPPGTPHCSGKNTMVLEISATPYIFTFKMWDWGRTDLDGNPRPINIDHGISNIQWDRTTNWVSDNLINKFEIIDEGEGWIEERTGLHEDSFIETRRYTFSTLVEQQTGGMEKGSVHVINLVEGDEIIIESSSDLFDPYIVHFAETLVIPASVGSYTMSPHGVSIGKKCMVIKAYVR